MTLYDYPFNFSNGTSVQGLGTWLQYADYTFGGGNPGYLAYAFLVAVFVISFAAMKNYAGNKALAASSFITMIIAVLLTRVITFNPIVTIGIIVMTVISVIWVAFEKPAGSI